METVEPPSKANSSFGIQLKPAALWTCLRTPTQVSTKLDAFAPQVVCWLLLFLLLVGMLLARDLPMVDLPQHEAQLATWIHANDPRYHADLFVLNYRTPYWLGYLLARSLAVIVGLHVALKLTAWLAVVGHVFGLWFLCKRLGHDRWLSVLMLPVALGYNFLFGFLSYIVAIPIMLLCLGFAVTFRATPCLRAGLWLLLCLLLLLLAHGIAFAQIVLCVGLLLAFGRPSHLLRLWPVVFAVVVAGLWLSRSTKIVNLGGDIWNPSLTRIASLPSLLLGSGGDDALATVAGLLLIVHVGFSLGRPKRDAAQLLPLLSVIVAYVGFPVMFRGYGPLWPRFAWLLLPTVLVAFESPVSVSASRRRLLRVGYTLMAVCCLLVFIRRLHGFNRETASFHAVIDTMPPDLRVRPIVFEPITRTFPGLPALNHLPAYYHSSKGGLSGYSFAMYPSSPLKYRDGVVSLMGGGLEWLPSAFRAEAELPNFDCFLVHSRPDRTDELFGRVRTEVSLRKRVGNWWNYCKVDVSM